MVELYMDKMLPMCLFYDLKVFCPGVKQVPIQKCSFHEAFDVMNEIFERQGGPKLMLRLKQTIETWGCMFPTL